MDIEDCLPSSDISSYIIKHPNKYVTCHPPLSINIKNHHHHSNKMIKIHIKTFGCSHNFCDSEYMSGILISNGYYLTNDIKDCELCIINSCTVKNPSESVFHNYIKLCEDEKKKIILAGCCPQSSKMNKLYEKYSIIGVNEIDRVEYVVNETLKGNVVKLSNPKKKVKQFILPKVRKNYFIEIIPIASGCLHNCTYCKTKLARGNLRSYEIPEICFRIQQVIKENIKEIRITAEDVGAYGIDLGTNIVQLLKTISKINLGDTMIRIGMANPTYILDHLNQICEVLNQKNFYKFIHIPIQSASDQVLSDMKRDYSLEDFEKIIDTLLRKVPGISIATDIICGFPTDTEELWKETIDLVKKYKFPIINISQFYSRPGTLAHKMKKLNSKVVKNRSRELTKLFESYKTFDHLMNTEQKVLLTEIAHDKVHLCGRTIDYVQVLIDPTKANLGEWVNVKIFDTQKFYVKGKVIKKDDVGKIMISKFSQGKKKSKKLTSVYSYSNWTKVLFFIVILSFFVLFVYNLFDVELIY